MGANNILLFCPDGSEEAGDLLSLDSYRSDSGRLRGHQPGIARRELENRALRQATYMASVLAQFIADKAGVDVTDSGPLANLVTALGSAVQASGGTPPDPSGDLSALSASLEELRQALNNHISSGGNGSGGGGGTGLNLTLEQLKAVFQPIACSSSNIPGALMYITPDTVLPAGGTWMYYYWSVDVFSGEAYDGIQSTGIMAGGQKIVQSGHTNVAGFAWRTA